jgi:hypothetical protein
MDQKTMYLLMVLKLRGFDQRYQSYMKSRIMEDVRSDEDVVNGKAPVSRTHSKASVSKAIPRERE